MLLLVAGVAPRDAAGLDWLDGMAEENRDEFGAALVGTELLEPFLREAAAAMGESTGDTIAEALGGLVTEVDRQALHGPFSEYLAAVMRGALRDG